MIELSLTYTYEGALRENGSRCTAQRKIKTGDTISITFLGASEEPVRVEEYNPVWDCYDNISCMGENFYFKIVVNDKRTYYGKYADYRYTENSVATGPTYLKPDRTSIGEEQVRHALLDFKEWLYNGAKGNSYWHGLYAKKDFPEKIAYGMPGEAIEHKPIDNTQVKPGVVIEEGDDIFSVDGIRYEIHERYYWTDDDKRKKEKYLRVLPLKDGAKYAGKVVIPAQVKYHRRSLNVTSVDANAFKDCPNLHEIVVPSCTDFGNFREIDITGCLGLKAINIEEGHEKYESIDGVVYYKDKTKIAYYPANHSETFEIPSTVKSIGEEFNNCTVLREIVIPESVTSLQRKSFEGCTGLQHIVIPGSITCIPDFCFDDCSSLKTVVISEGVETLELAFRNCTSLQEIIMPDSLVSAIPGAFKGCENINSVRFPKDRYFNLSIPDRFLPGRQKPFYINGVYYKPYDAYENKMGLVRVVNVPEEELPQVVCSGVETVNIPEVVEQYGFTYRVREFWSNCKQFPDIKRLELPATIMGFNFYRQNSIKEYAVDADNPNYTSVDGILYSKDLRSLISVPGGMELTELKVKDGVEIIPSEALQGIKDLQKVILPDTVKTIGSRAFANCTSLTTVLLPSSLTDICQRQFSGGRPFEGCSNLKEFVLAEDDSPFTTIDGVLYQKTNYGLVLIYCPTGYTGRLIIPDGVIKISYDAFRGAEKLVAVEIPDSVERIESWAFAECKSLKEVIFSRNLKYVGSCAFRECTSLKVLDFTRCRHYFGWDGIESDAFYKCPQLKLMLPSNIEHRREYFEREMKK